jgi:hypothetical protein
MIIFTIVNDLHAEKLQNIIPIYFNTITASRVDQIHVTRRQRISASCKYDSTYLKVLSSEN